MRIDPVTGGIKLEKREHDRLTQALAISAALERHTHDTIREIAAIAREAIQQLIAELAKEGDRP